MPLIIKVPWKLQTKGKTTDAIVELVDMYKTLADLTGLGPVESSVQGESFALEFDTIMANRTEKPAFSQICQFFNQLEKIYTGL